MTSFKEKAAIVLFVSFSVFVGAGLVVLPIYGRLALCHEYYPRLTRTACLFAGKIAVVDPGNIAEDAENHPDDATAFASNKGKTNKEDTDDEEESF